MNPNDTSRHEDLLTRLMAQYDEALASDTLLGELDESVVEFDPQLATEWEEAKGCLELLDRARRGGFPPPLADLRTARTLGSAGPGPTQIRHVGRFKIERELGRGGLGIVYLAHDPQLGRKVAIKIPRFEALLSDDSRRRFLRESEAAARLSHPHLVALYEVGEDGPICYLASEYCEGPTLAEWLRRRSRPVPARQAAVLVLQLAEAVQHAHSRGVLHRDIKPSNVLLDGTATSAHSIYLAEHLDVSAKLTDFGMAKLLEQNSGETRAGAIIGTLAYMSPEQAEGRVDALDVRTDVYSLGAILYELLLGAPPYVGKTEADTLRQVLINAPVAPRKIRSDLPRDAEAICLKCLEKRPAGRYGTAGELAADLRRYLSYEPTLARPLSYLQRTVRWARRRPVPAILIAGSLIAAGLFLATGVAYTVRLRQHADELRRALNAKDEATSTARLHVEAARRAYPSDMRLSQQAWKDGRVADAIALLEKHRPQSAETDYRSFAWRFLWSLCHRDHPMLLGHAGPVYVCRYSPDGRILATAGEDGQVRLWDPAGGKLVHSWTAHEKGINCISFSADAMWMATTSEDAGAVWDVATGQLVRRLEIGDGSVMALAFSPDGQTLVVGGGVDFIELLDTADWSPRGRLTCDITPTRLLAVSPDGGMLASASDDPAIRLWDLKNLRQTATLEGHTRTITAIAFSHDGFTLASTSEDGRVKLWETAQHREILTLERHRGYMHDVAFTPDDRWILAADDEGSAQFSETHAASPGRALWCADSKFYGVAISPDGRQAATAGNDGFVRLWNGAANPEMVRIAGGDPGRAADISPDSQFAAVGDYSGNVRLYDLATRKSLKQFTAHGSSPIGEICFSKRGDLLVTAGNDNAIRLWSFPALALLRTLEGHRDRIWNLRVSPDGALVATCSEDGTVKLWDSASGTLRHDLRPPDVSRDIALSADNHQIAAACNDGKIYVWRVTDGVQTAALDSQQDSANLVTWSPDGKLLASGGNDEVIFLWDMERLALASRISTGRGRVTALAFSPDSTSLASSADLTFKIWDVASREAILTLTGLGAVVSKVGFVGHGDLLFSLSDSKSCDLFLWPVRQPDENATRPMQIERDGRH